MAGGLGMNGRPTAGDGATDRRAATRGPSDRVVVVHGHVDPALDVMLRSSGLVPVHEAEGAVIWAPPTTPVPENPSAAPEGSGKLLLTIMEVAERLSVGRSTVYELINRGTLEVVHVGRAVRVPAIAVERMVAGLRSERPSLAGDGRSVGRRPGSPPLQ
jgi:excisionase family DNA binding protein